MHITINITKNVLCSPRHRKQLASNALTLTAEIGRPHLFITVTIDKNCPEIVEMLLPGQEAYDRPDIVCRVFHAKMRSLKRNLKNGKYFGSKCVYIVYVIEYQHRGLPHAHIIIRLLNGPNHDDMEECLEFIEKYINSTLPGIDEPEYRQLVQTKLLHKCSEGVNGCLNANGICTKKFKKNVTVNKSYFDDKNFPVYKRPNGIVDWNVVPNNKELTMDLKCHVNVEFCISVYAVMYLYKYLFKGSKKLLLI